MTQDNGNGRITMAILGERMDQMLRRMERVEGKVDTVIEKQSTAQSNYDVCSTRQAERWTQHGQDHQALARKHWAADIVGPAIAALVGWLAKAPLP